MGKPTGFMDYPRQDASDRPISQRVSDFQFIHGSLGFTARKEQAGRCMNCGVPFCQTSTTIGGKTVGCPLNNLIPEWNEQLWNDNLPLALDRLLKTNCFPEFTGYVCPALCEQACSCRLATEDKRAVSINDNERFIIDTAFERGLMQPRVPARRSGKTIAVVGSGPAGLTVAQLLNQRGHTVIVYERNQRPGGLLTYGIPNMKLPKTVVARRIALMEEEGVRFECNTNIGVDLSIPTLSQQYDAVVLAIGAQAPRAVKFEGHATGVCFALDYLGSCARAYLREAACDSSLTAQGKTVAVIGAGDTANDCIATALRQGAHDIVQLIRRPGVDYGAACDYAHQEAMAVFGRDVRRFETQVASVRANDQGALCALELSAAGSMQDGTPHEKQVINAELLIIASGFTGAESYATQGINLNECPNIFQAGDMATGATLVASAMAHARNTARAADIFLTGYSDL